MIKLASPDIRAADIERAVRVIESGNLVQGQTVSAFERALSAYTGIPHCAVVSSGTAALHLALLALKIGPGDGVVVPAFTFPATGNAVENTGAHVLLCDVHPRSYVVTPEDLEKIITENRDKNIKAVIVVHEFGYPAEIESISSLTQRHGVRLIEDAACALGTIVGGHHVGYFGDVACFSFHARKAITTGEGGALISRDPALIETVRRLRSHGMGQRDDHRVDFVMAGLNYRMTEFQAALGIGQLERYPVESSRRCQIAQHYLSLLKDLEFVALPEPHDGHSWQSFMVVLDADLDRDEVVRVLREHGVETTLGAQALNALVYYKVKYGLSEENFPRATHLYQHGLALPVYGKLSEKDIDEVCSTLMTCLTGSMG